MNKSKNIPFDFVIEELFELNPVIKPMFGCHAIYIKDKITIIVRKKSDHVEANGIWIATEKKHHESLKKDIGDIGSVYILSNGKNETEWQMIHEHDDDFEEKAYRICSLIRKNDSRIGKIPKKKKKQVK